MNEELKKLEELLANDRKTIEENYKEIERLTKVEQEHQRINGELREENKRLNNIINELEKYGKQRFNEYEAWKEECKNLCYINGITEMLDKLQELKGEIK